MADAMVTARMSQMKKDAGNRVLQSLGYSASSVINELYDYLIQHKELPFPAKEQHIPPTKEQILEAMEWLDGISRVGSDEFSNMSLKEARRHRLASKGLIDGDDAE